MEWMDEVGCFVQEVEVDVESQPLLRPTSHVSYTLRLWYGHFQVACLLARFVGS
jgi:hypothetical protein